MPLCKNYKHYYLFLLWQEEIVEVGMIKPNGALCSIFWKEIGSSDQFPHHHALPNIDFSPGSKKNTRCKQKAGDHAWHYLHYSCFAKHAALIKPILRQLEKKKNILYPTLITMCSHNTTSHYDLLVAWPWRQANKFGEEHETDQWGHCFLPWSTKCLQEL